MTTVEPGAPSDRDLVEAFKAGDHQAFVALMQRHERRVYSLAYRMLGTREDARDAAQEAFLSCYRHLDAFRGDSAFGTWLHRIAVNTCYDMLRKRVAEPVQVDDARASPNTSHDPADEASAAVDVQTALLRIPPEFRAVLVMFELQDLPIETIAATLEIPPGTVKSRLHRGRVALARALSPEPEAHPVPSKAPDP